MKKLALFFLLGFVSFSFAQKYKKSMKNKEIAFSTKKFIFHSEADHGNKNRGFILLNNQEELNNALNDDILYDIDEIQEKQFLTFPKNQKVILYHFGEFRSGIHQAKGIEKVKLIGENLEVYLIRNKNTASSSFDPMEPKIEVQVVTRPKMIFSVPKNFNFKNIIIK